MVADRGLRDVAAGGEVAGADVLTARELAQDREPGGVRRTLQQQGIRVDEALHDRMVLTNIYIVKYQYHRQRTGHGQQGDTARDEGAP